MTRDEYLEVLATVPATARQLGAIQRELDRLGVSPRADRLAIIAALAGVDGLSTSRDLLMGQAGQALAALMACRTGREVRHLTRPARTVADVLADLGAVIRDALGSVRL